MFSFDVHKNGSRGPQLVHSLSVLAGGERMSCARAGGGMGFTVRMPLAGDADPSHGGASGPAPGGARRILVVDDNADSADTLQALLEIEGHEVRTAYRGEQALEIAPVFRPDIVLLDVGLPGMDGLAVCRALRADPVTREAFVIAMTGWGQTDDRRRTQQAGFDLHLVKPVDPAELSNAIASGPVR